MRAKYDGVSMLDVPFADVFDEWDRRTAGYQDLAALRALCLWDRFFLLAVMMGRTDALHPWIYARCREVERDPDGRLDIWARGHYKSTVITLAGVIQEVLRDPEVCVGIFSHTKQIAKAFLRQIKNEMERNERLKALFPDVLYGDPDKEAPLWSLDAGIIVRRKTNPKEATVEAWGLVDGMPTSKHFALMVYDDVVTKESVNTPEQVAKSIEAWELSDNLGSDGARKWHIGTRYDFNDAYAEIMRRGAVALRLHPATHDGTLTGRPVLLSPEEWAEKIRTQGEATVSCQMLGNPLAGNMRMFDAGDLETYEVRPQTLAVYILCDPARSKKRDSDETAMLVVGLDAAANKYVLDGFAHRMALQERWDSLARLVLRWRQATGVQSVKVGYEAYAAEADLDYFREQQRLSKLHFDIEELRWPRDGDGAKRDRVQRLGPDLRSGKIFLPYPTDDEKLTAAQRRMAADGYEYRVARRIRRRDELGRAYDVGEKLRMQFAFFPFCDRKDLIDAFARIYDMEPKAPSYNEPAYSEPEYV